MLREQLEEMQQQNHDVTEKDREELQVKTQRVADLEDLIAKVRLGRPYWLCLYFCAKLCCCESREGSAREQDAFASTQSTWNTLIYTHIHTQEREAHAAELARQEEAAASRQAAIVEEAK